MTAQIAPVAYAARLAIDYPERLDRLSTLFRLIWIIPIAIVLSLLTASGNQTMVTASGQQVAGTGGGLLAGLAVATALMIIVRLRYPRWWFDFARELTRFGARISAYLALLTDRYPSTVDEQSVHLEIEYPDVERDLNRWLPLVKWLLAIPHYFVLLFLWIGALVAIVIAWFAILITGRYPKPLFDYVVGVSRWTLRVTAYAFLLVTDRYPPFSLKRRSLAMTNFPTNSWRTLALAGGVLYLMTFAFSIPAVFLLEPVLSNPDYIVSGGPDSQVLLGTLFDLITALACIGTAVALFPVIRRQSEAASLGFVTTRIFEAAIIVIGVASLMAVVAMRQAGASNRNRFQRTGRGWPGARRGSRSDVLAGTRRDARPQRLVARLCPVSVATRAASDPGGWTHRSPNLPCVGYRHPPGRQRAGLPVVGNRGRPDIFLGAVARPLADVQGLQPDLPAHNCR